MAQLRGEEEKEEGGSDFEKKLKALQQEWEKEDEERWRGFSDLGSKEQLEALQKGVDVLRVVVMMMGLLRRLQEQLDALVKEK